MISKFVRIGRNSLKIKKFIDFDKQNQTFYNNLYLNDIKIVIKIPLVNKERIDERINRNIKIEKFDLSKCAYLLSYD